MNSIATQGDMKCFLSRCPVLGDIQVTYHASRLFICPVVRGRFRQISTVVGTRQLYSPLWYTPSSSARRPRRWRFWNQAYTFSVPYRPLSKLPLTPSP